MESFFYVTKYFEFEGQIDVFFTEVVANFHRGKTNSMDKFLL